MKEEILIVDDDKEDLDIIEQAFNESEKFSVKCFSTSTSLLIYLKSVETNLPSLIITDYNMPTIDGFSIVAFIKRSDKYSSINIAILTDYISEFEKDRLLKAGVYKIFKKPNTIEGYARIVQEMEQSAGK